MEECKRNQLRLILEIEVQDKEGNVIAVRRIEKDLMLDNFKNLLAAIFYPETSSLTTAEVKDTGGITRTLEILLSTAYFGGTSPTGVRIAVGTGTTTPARTDYKLESQVAEKVPTQSIAADAISWQTEILFTTTVTLSEAGMIGNYYSAAAAALVDILIFRDLIDPALPVPAGGKCVVTYTLGF